MALLFSLEKVLRQGFWTSVFIDATGLTAEGGPSGFGF